jgi:hypothetical protein
MRQCGDCQLCCKLVPVKSLAKLAGQRCSHQSHAKGCKVHANLARVAPECKLWNCRWLTEDDTADLRRPDRSHYVIDIMPDFVTLRNDETGERTLIEVVQIWVDPNYPDAHRDPALRAYLERRAKENKASIVRFDNQRGLGIFPPALSSDRQWHEVDSALRDVEHSLQDVANALGGEIQVHVEEVPNERAY